MDVSFFAEMAWKSALISAAALMLTYVLRSRSAADRALVLRIGVAMLLLLPPIALMLPALQIEAWAAPETPAAAAQLSAAELIFLAEAAASLPPAEPTIWDDPTPLVILAYLGGLLMVGSRLFAGLWMLGRWTRSAEEVTCPEWQSAFDRTRWAARRPEAIRLMVSDSVPSPLSWGWRRPVILIDPDTLADPKEADAILAHEVAHIARGDWPVLMLTRAAASLFWFNPLVWLLEREIVQQAEEAADCEATDLVEPARYAKTLLTWAQVEARALPAHSIAPTGSALSRRVKAILDRKVRERQSGSAWTAIAMLMCIGIAAPVAAMELVHAARAPQAPGAPAAPSAVVAPVPPAGAPVPAALAVPEAPLPPELNIEIPDVGPAVEAALAQVMPQIPAIVASAMAAGHPHMTEEDFREMERELGQLRTLNREEVREAMREARRAMTEARVQARVVDREQFRAAMAAAREARAVAVRAPRAMAVSMAHGADGMMRGAESMERGAERMEEQARRLRTDRDYRERQIARARARGEEVTHEELIEAADGMEEGARGMREGARGMREAARDMREGHH